jgi:hypothetical protein
VAPTIERIDSGCASNLMRVLIRLTAPQQQMRKFAPAISTRRTSDTEV